MDDLYTLFVLKKYFIHVYLKKNYLTVDKIEL